MSTTSPGPADPSPSPAPPAARRRPAILVAIVLVSAAAVTALALGAYAVWSQAPDDTPPAASTTPSATDPTAPPPSADPTDPPTSTGPTAPATDYTVSPSQTWQVSAADLMAGDPAAIVELAVPDPLGRPATQDTVVVTASTASTSSVIGLDRESGAEVWRVEVVPAGAASCHVLGTGASTVCVSSGASAGAEDYSVVTLETSTGTALGQDSVDFKPATVAEIDGDVVLAGSSLLTGALVTTRGTPDDVAARWTASSDAGYVPATEYYGGFVVDEGIAWSYVAGATMVVDLSTGDARSLSAASGEISTPWPGGTVMDYSTVSTDPAVVTVTTPGASQFTAQGYPWAWLGSSSTMTSFVGIGNTAYDARTGTPLWSMTADPAALSTTYTAVDDLVLQQTWWEESVSLTAVDALTGTQRWTGSTRSAWHFSQAGDVLLADTSYGIEAVDLATGAEPWMLDYTDLVTGDSTMYQAVHSIAGPSLVTTFGETVTGYSFD